MHESGSPHCRCTIINSLSFTFFIFRDIKEIVKNPLPGVSLELDEEDFMTIHALIVGPQGTPYENGFFYFILKFPYDYPWNPPNVQLMTTGNGTVRFNPNFYSSGKVCLSILGTWPGPGWTPQMTLSSVLLSMQSLMNEKPYCNEPGRDAERCPGDFEKYNLVIRHDTLRVAVLGMVKNTSSLTMPRPFTVQIQKEFLHNYNFYEEIAVTNIHLSGTPNV
ncbi:Ubiquitin-conjugating enzyme E2 Z, partial [Frankliniella fusca]